MKRINRYILACLAACTLFACEEGIDPIQPLEPEADATPPTVIIKYPGDGVLIRVREDVTPIKIEVEVMDDVEIKGITVRLDGATVTEFTDFRDYRHAIESYVYAGLTNGSHLLTVEAADLSGKTTTATAQFEKVQPYSPLEGEVFYMPFDGDYLELVSIIEATRVGVPSFSAGKTRQAYAGAPDAYLTFKTEELVSPLAGTFSAAFWYKPDGAPDRSGILTISPDDEGKAAGAKNNRTAGLRLFREGSATNQTIKLNVGDGTADSWFDGGATASFNPATSGWIHVAFTISPEQCTVYLDGEVVCRGASPGVSWAGCDLISIASGAPRFTEWSHLSDNSLYDEMRFFGKALSQEEVRNLMNN
ncbi:MAG: LamG domain-containing protein [Tannerellaceae bacterium]|jgi:hypothetical protein|nr:LamG domain-containing protein [Tannerellaceae bacterium]